MLQSTTKLRRTVTTLFSSCRSASSGPRGKVRDMDGGYERIKEGKKISVHTFESSHRHRCGSKTGHVHFLSWSIYFFTCYHDGRHEPNFVSAITFEGEMWCATGADCVKLFVKTFQMRKIQELHMHCTQCLRI